uniref:Putative secreted protein synganglion overexpressed n=1 Tax=Rhipicephalus microplus TaxID=6941 RepID=A0A6M2DF86_RHIMP
MAHRSTLLVIAIACLLLCEGNAVMRRPYDSEAGARAVFDASERSGSAAHEEQGRVSGNCVATLCGQPMG